MIPCAGTVWLCMHFQLGWELWGSPELSMTCPGGSGFMVSLCGQEEEDDGEEEEEEDENEEGK